MPTLRPKTVIKGSRTIGVPTHRTVKPPLTRRIQRSNDGDFIPGLGETLPGMGEQDDDLAAFTPLARYGKVENGPQARKLPGAGTRAVATSKMYRSIRMPRDTKWMPGMGNLGAEAMVGGNMAWRQPNTLPTAPIPPKITPQHAVIHAPAAMHGLFGTSKPRWRGAMVGGNVARWRGAMVGGNVARWRGAMVGGNMARRGAVSSLPHAMFGLGSDTNFALANQGARVLKRGKGFDGRTISSSKLGRPQPIPGTPKGGIFPGLFCDDVDDTGPATQGYMTHDQLSADMIPTPAGPVSPADAAHFTVGILGVTAAAFAIGFLLRRA